MKNIFENWSELKGSLSKPLFFITDYDGTLTPIVDKPEDAELSERMKDRLKEIRDTCPVGIVSGRSLDDLISRVGIDGIYYSGNHGYEIRGPGLDFQKEEATEAEGAIKEICRSVMEKSTSIEGLLVENKKLTASIHYRLVKDEDIPEIEDIIEEEVEPYQNKGIVETNYGKKVYEIKPNLDWDKGKAVSLLRERVGFKEEGTTIYLGDDETDEDVFSTFGEKGLGILVSQEEKESSASYRLKGVEEVGRFIEELTAILGDSEK